MMRTASLVALLAALAWAPVATEASPSPDQALRTQIERYLRERAPITPSGVEIPSLQDFALAWLAPGDVRVVLSTAEQQRLGSVPVAITVYVGDELAKHGVVTARVRAERSVFRTSRPLARGALVHREDLREERRDVSEVPTAALLDPEAIVGQRTTRALPAGAVLRSTHLRAAQLVTRGQIVRLNFKSGALAIAGVGKARQDGRPGDRIRVINVDSRREVQGVITAAGEVDVAL